MLDKNIGYYFITDSNLSLKGNINDVTAACEAGVQIVQYRNKIGTTKQMFEEALILCKICKKNNVLFLVNDRIDIALAIDADGVHIGTDDMPYPMARKILGRNKIIGLSTHSLNEARVASFSDVNYIAFGSVFSTTTKENAIQNQGIEMLQKITSSVSIPVVAIGGIDLNNVSEVIKAGASGFCSISSVVTKENVKDEILKFNNLYVQKE